MKTEAEEKNKTWKKIFILTSVGFIMDVGQALIVYNSGKGAEAKALGSNYSWKFPKGKELMRTAGLVFVTSVITGLIVSGLETIILNSPNDNKTPV